MAVMVAASPCGSGHDVHVMMFPAPDAHPVRLALGVNDVIDPGRRRRC